MKQSATEEQILALVQNRTASELTRDEVRLLRQGLADSPKLRETFSKQLRLQRYLAELPQESHFDVDQPIISRHPVIISIVIVAIGVLGAGYWWYGSALLPSRLEGRSNQAKSQKTAAVPGGKAGRQSADRDPLTTSAAPTADRSAPSSSSKDRADATADSPWSDVLQQPPVEFGHVCFDTFDYQVSLLSADQLNQWFGPVPGQASEIESTETGLGRSVSFSGSLQLLAPLTNDTALRIAMADSNELELQFWSGVQLVAFRFDERQQAWSSYRKEPGLAFDRSHLGELLATEKCATRSRGYELGTSFEIRRRGDFIYLSHGDIVLVSAALSAELEQVIICGNATLLGIELLRTIDEYLIEQKALKHSGLARESGRSGPNSTDRLTVQLDALVQAVAADSSLDEDHLESLTRRLHSIATEMHHRRGAGAFSAIRRQLMATPNGDLILAASTRLIRRELLELLHATRWEELLRFCKMLRFYRLDKSIGWADWVSDLAAERSHVSVSSRTKAIRLRKPWRKLLVEPISSELYDFQAQLGALLESSAESDAAHLICSLPVDSAAGLVPSASDPALLVSLHAFLTSTIEQNSSLQQALREEATKRVGAMDSAFERQDAVTVEQSAIVFARLPAAANAHRWLGDRAFASGWLAEAGLHYERSAATMPSENGTDEQLQQRLDFIRSQPVTRAVLRGPHGSVSTIPDTTNRFLQGKRVMISQIDGALPEHDYQDNLDRLQVDWRSRQFALQINDGVVYANNRFQIVAIDAETGQTIWQSAEIPRRMRRSRDWPLVVMRPLVTRSRVISRLLYGDGACLVSLDRKTGQRIWTTADNSGTEFISDPFLLRNQVCCLTAESGDRPRTQISLAQIDPLTGAIWRDIELFQLHHDWQDRRYCEVQEHPDGVIVSLGGVLAEVTAAGKVKWVRTLTNLPPAQADDWVVQSIDPPLLTDSHVIAHQPGSYLLSCSELATGVRRWERVFPEIRQLVTIHRELAVIRETASLAAIDIRTGATVWSKLIPERSCVQANGHGQVLVVSSRASEQKLEMVWIGVESANMVSKEIATNASQSENYGPWICDGNSLWILRGESPDHRDRELVQFVID